MFFAKLMPYFNLSLLLHHTCFRYHMLHAPLGKSDEEEEQFLDWLHYYAAKRPVPLSVTVPTKLRTANYEFQRLCEQFGMLDLYLWLEMRYPVHFHQREECLEQREIALYWIDQYLQHRPAELVQKTFSKESYHYQHHMSYKEARQSLGKKRPAKEYPDIYKSVKEHLSNVPTKDLLRLNGTKVNQENQESEGQEEDSALLASLMDTHPNFKFL